MGQVLRLVPPSMGLFGLLIYFQPDNLPQSDDDGTTVCNAVVGNKYRLADLSFRFLDPVP